MLQPWQAYQALMYEKQWKAEVDEEWEKYKQEWASDHPDEEPMKSWFQIIIEFMKVKYEGETEDMKDHCEEYRKTLMEESEVLVNVDASRNLQFQR